MTVLAFPTPADRLCQINRAGYEAAFRPYVPNPYAKGTKEYQAWARGFWDGVER